MRNSIIPVPQKMRLGRAIFIALSIFVIAALARFIAVKVLVFTYAVIDTEQLDYAFPQKTEQRELYKKRLFERRMIQNSYLLKSFSEGNQNSLNTLYDEFTSESLSEFQTLILDYYQYLYGACCRPGRDHLKGYQALVGLIQYQALSKVEEEARKAFIKDAIYWTSRSAFKAQSYYEVNTPLDIPKNIALMFLGAGGYHVEPIRPYSNQLALLEAAEQMVHHSNDAYPNDLDMQSLKVYLAYHAYNGTTSLFRRVTPHTCRREIFHQFAVVEKELYKTAEKLKTNEGMALTSFHAPKEDMRIKGSIKTHFISPYWTACLELKAKGKNVGPYWESEK